jgi:hypothetical protein
MQLVPDLWLDGWIDWVVQAANLKYHAAVLPCRATTPGKIVIKTEWIEQFFSRAGVSF